MLAVAFAHTEVQNFLQQWEYVLCHFQADAIYCVGGPPPEGAVLSSAVQIVNSQDIPSALSLVLLAPENGLNVQGDESLVDFVHPDDVVYWFGSDSRHIELELFEGRSPDHKVFVPVDTADQAYSFMVYGIVAWDRRCKGA